MKKAAFKAAFPYTIPVLTGYIFLGIAFGVLLASKGFDFIWAFFMSVVIYAGAMQFVAIDVLTGTFNVLGTAMLTLLVNARHLFYGLSMLTRYKGMGAKKGYAIFALTDETYSIICSVPPPDNVDKGWFYFFISVLDHLYWITGSVIGAVAGTAFKFDVTGIDFVMTALFVVIFTEQWEKNPNHTPALAGVGLTMLCLMVFGPQNFIVFSMLAILTFLTVFKKHVQKGVKPDEHNTGAV